MKTELALLLTCGRPTMTDKEVADLMGIGVRTLQNQVYAKECPIPMFKMGSNWAAHVTDVAKYIDDQRKEATKLLRPVPEGA